MIDTTISPSPNGFSAARPDARKFGKATGDRRKAPRYKMAIPALLEFADDQVIPVTITDMSRAGFACDSRQIFPVGTQCWLKLPCLPGTQHFTMMEAKVVRCNGSLLGCAFSYMLHPEELDPFIAEYKVAA